MTHVVYWNPVGSIFSTVHIAIISEELFFGEIRISHVLCSFNLITMYTWWIFYGWRWVSFGAGLKSAEDSQLTGKLRVSNFSVPEKLQSQHKVFLHAAFQHEFFFFFNSGFIWISVTVFVRSDNTFCSFSLENSPQKFSWEWCFCLLVFADVLRTRSQQFTPR